MRFTGSPCTYLFHFVHGPCVLLCLLVVFVSPWTGNGVRWWGVLFVRRRGDREGLLATRMWKAWSKGAGGGNLWFGQTRIKGLLFPSLFPPFKSSDKSLIVFSWDELLVTKTNDLSSSRNTTLAGKLATRAAFTNTHRGPLRSGAITITELDRQGGSLREDTSTLIKTSIQPVQSSVDSLRKQRNAFQSRLDRPHRTSVWWNLWKTHRSWSNHRVTADTEEFDQTSDVCLFPVTVYVWVLQFLFHFSFLKYNTLLLCNLMNFQPTSLGLAFIELKGYLSFRNRLDWRGIQYNSFSVGQKTRKNK